MTGEGIKPSYDHKKIVEEFEKWLDKEYVPIEVRGAVHHSERVEVQNKFLATKRKYMLLK